MKEEEQKIWRDHQSRLAAISREKSDFARAYNEKREAIIASNGEIRLEETLKIARDAIETSKDIHNREHAELVRYMDEIKAYDRSRSPEPEKKELPETEKEHVSELKSRFLGKFDRSRTPDQDSREKDIEKEKDIDKDDI